MAGVIVVYLGLACAFAGVILMVRPVAPVRTRRWAAAVATAGVTLAVIGAALPAREHRVIAARTRLDVFMPAYQFHEVHSIQVRAASRDQIYRAVRSVTADEIFLFRALTWLRRFGRRGPESILTAPERAPILDVATKTTFLLLAEEPGREIVVGTLVLAPPGWRPPARPTPEGFKALHAPGFALAAMNFRVEDTGLVTTETRIVATDAAARRRFAVYWRLIYPGSTLLRFTWLRAIARRAPSS